MDLGCSCVTSSDYDVASIYDCKIVKARKTYTCCECGEEIKKGAKYEHVSGLWDGNWEHYKTCLLCVRIRRDVYCGSFVHMELREVISEVYGFDYVTGESWDEE